MSAEAGESILRQLNQGQMSVRDLAVGGGGDVTSDQSASLQFKQKRGEHCLF